MKRNQLSDLGLLECKSKTTKRHGRQMRLETETTSKKVWAERLEPIYSESNSLNADYCGRRVMSILMP